MTSLKVLSAGLQTLVQDLGRPAGRPFGVPLSGALDAGWLRLANGLVGNPDDAAGLEIRLIGPLLEAEADGIRLAVAGQAQVLAGPDGAMKAVEPWRTVTLKAGERVQVKAVQEGTVAYLAVAGGIDVPVVMGSRSTYVRAAIGGLEGRALKDGDRLPVGVVTVSGPDQVLPDPPTAKPAPVRVVLGPQDDHFTEAALKGLQGATFKIGNEADRMGLRLAGPTLQHREAGLAEIISEGVVPGSIQVPGNGQPILLLADGQTVGGYAKIATVISADLGRIARMAPGTEVHFKVIDLEAAEDAAIEAERQLKAALASIRPMRDGLDLDALYQGNLVGGVIDSTDPDHFPGHLET